MNKPLKKLLIIALVSTLLYSCKEMKKDNNAAFDTFKGRFVEALWKTYPTWANNLGYHKYDSVLVVPDTASRKKEMKFNKDYEDSLHTFTITDLNTDNQIDYRMIENQIEYAKWGLTDLKQFEWDPSLYNVGDAFALLLTEHYAPLDNRLRSFAHKLPLVTAYYQAARASINKPAMEQTDLAIQQNSGLADIFEKQLPDTLKKSGLSETEKQEILKNSALAVTAIKGYVDWLKNDVVKQIKAGQGRSFRIGKALYDKKFDFELESHYTAEEIYQKALKRKDEVHAEMAKRAKELWPKYFGNTLMPDDRLVLIRKVLDTIASEHANRDSFQADIETLVPKIIDFVNKKDLVFIDPKKPLVIRQTPDYKEGFSVASIDAPGPYDKYANTYYNVGSLKKYDAKGAESFLREYNKYTIQIISIHEAIPGHYVQLMHANQSPDIIKTIFSSGAMVEGWAVYTERMMMEEGYGDNDPALWLMYYKWHLRAVCNTILDYGLQVNNMSEADAMNLMEKEGFQEESEAEGKYRRATLSQAQLCYYFTGFSEIYDLREELKKKLGDKFSLKQFHEKFLSYGSAPVKYIREMMLADNNW